MKGSIIKIGITYTYILDVGRDPITGKRKQKTKGGFLRKKDAEAALRKILSEIDDNKYVEPSTENFASFIDKWFTSHYQKRIKETTASNRRNLLDVHLIKENPFANKPISKITTFDIDAFYSLKIDQEYSTSYIRKMHQMLNQAFQQAVKWKKISSNPATDASPPSVKTEEIRIWSLDEINTFLGNCRNENHHITFLLAIYTGMRRGEILGLKWTDIDFDKKIIKVERSLAYIPEKGYILTSVKTKASKRQIPIPRIVIKELLKHLEVQSAQKLRLGESYNDLGLVICNETGNLQDPRNIIRIFRRLCTSADVNPIRFHDIRHTHASILISEGVDIVKVSKRLGHANPKITLGIYSHLVPDVHNDVAEIFDAAVQQKC
jgi:integrase